jgi:hypothetical protein
LALIDLSSAQLIIEILQKDSNISTTPECLSNNITTTPHEEVYHEVDNNWKLVTSRHSHEPKELMKHVTLPNSQMFATSNRYSMLAVFNEADRSDNKSSNPMELESLNKTSKYHNRSK